MNKESLSEIANENVEFVAKKRAAGKSFSEIAAIMRAKGMYTNAGACNKAYNKYRNVKTEIGGMVFDSKKEANRFQELAMLQKAGIIKNLECQKKFLIIPKTKDEREVYYLADFVYELDGKQICEDVKSRITRKNTTYIIKRKLFKHLYPDWEFRET